MSTLQTLDRGLWTLNFVSLQPSGVLVSEIAEALGVHRAIAYRIVGTEVFPSGVLAFDGYSPTATFSALTVLR
ncbi:hypothetical protein JOF55_003816 [Haloactinomyces albus]|uniref:Helix-turn-helix domain-containing protein n=1 Tax=Haloactinomyces albus TaxID=1352928 RepID=A0AAE3ZH38_9ACTN|nr:helix-turn-helix domain-containing protein [Haloactinomyces albus]MDR7303635.1 hypothetical protein [Haloactinomyces albus]